MGFCVQQWQWITAAAELPGKAIDALSPSKSKADEQDDEDDEEVVFQPKARTPARATPSPAPRRRVAPAVSGVSMESLERMTVPELRKECAAEDLWPMGKKDELVQRLYDHKRKRGGDSDGSPAKRPRTADTGGRAKRKRA